ncbi:hypothetical protein [Anaerotignum sp.]|uniref:hypothetical protein n=1 Tax=Anaerotignum sp. TaxID=2039241 RepID=UPI00289A2BB9|nr:hypothetical protein [Anaerotignum sp.]
MRDFQDRLAEQPNRYKITEEGGGIKYATIERADNPTRDGTLLNREVFMALQGFQETNTMFNEDGSITELNGAEEPLVTTFNADGSITETFTNTEGVVIAKKTIFQADGSIQEVFV